MSKRKNFIYQCARELLRDGKLILGKYHYTGYNNHLFKEIHPYVSYLHINGVGANNSELVVYADFTNTIIEKSKASTSIDYTHYD